MYALLWNLGGIVRYLLRNVGRVEPKFEMTQASPLWHHFWVYLKPNWRSTSSMRLHECAGCPNDRRSTRGFAIYIGKNLISWSFKKQHTISWSFRRVRIDPWHILLLKFCSFVLCSLKLVMVFNHLLWGGTTWVLIYLTANPRFNARTKHIELDYHFVHEFVAPNLLKFIGSFLRLTKLLISLLPLSHKNRHSFLF